MLLKRYIREYGCRKEYLESIGGVANKTITTDVAVYRYVYNDHTKRLYIVASASAMAGVLLYITIFGSLSALVLGTIAAVVAIFETPEARSADNSSYAMACRLLPIGMRMALCTIAYRVILSVWAMLEYPGVAARLGRA